MEYTYTVETEKLFSSHKFDEQNKNEEEQIINLQENEIVTEQLNNDDILLANAIENIYNDDSNDEDINDNIYNYDDEEIIKEILDYELNEVNDDVEKIVLKDVIIILNPQDVVVKKKRNYTDANRRAQQKYREKYPEKYRELQRKVYNNLKQNEEWKKNYNEKARDTQKKYRDKKREEKIANGEEVKGRGRPRKLEGRGRPRKLVCEVNNDEVINQQQQSQEINL